MRVIPLTKGFETIVDDEDYDWLVTTFTWWARVDGNRTYACTKIKGRGIGMHAVIISPPKGMEVDHCNLNPLDNRRCNLRLATRSQNVANGSRAPGRFGYRGVLQTNNQKGYGAQIRVNGQHHYLGSFPTIEDAARAYDAAAREHFGEFARPNFPVLSEGRKAPRSA